MNIDRVEFDRLPPEPDTRRRWGGHVRPALLAAGAIAAALAACAALLAAGGQSPTMAITAPTKGCP